MSLARAGTEASAAETPEELKDLTSRLLGFRVASVGLAGCCPNTICNCACNDQLSRH